MIWISHQAGVVCRHHSPNVVHFLNSYNGHKSIQQVVLHFEVLICIVSYFKLLLFRNKVLYNVVSFVGGLVL